MVLLRWSVHLNDGDSSGATTRVTARTTAGKSGQGGFPGSYIELRASAHVDNHPESNLHPNQ
jgi:hypothetical protein